MFIENELRVQQCLVEEKANFVFPEYEVFIEPEVISFAPTSKKEKDSKYDEKSKLVCTRYFVENYVWIY